MSNFSYNELIINTVNKFVESANGEDSLFQQGTTLEILSDEGKKHIKQSILTILEGELSKAKEEARKLLLERETISVIRRHVNLDKIGVKALDERSHGAQIAYQESYKKVVELQTLLNDFVN